MKNFKWTKVLDDVKQLPEGRVTTVTANNHDFCLTHHEGKFCILDNKCPHQGGPLGEGSIENGLLRCPWHGWDYDPCTGKVPGYDDGVETYETKVEEGSVFIGLKDKEPEPKTVADVMVETMVNWGVDTVFGMVGHSNLGLADAFRKMEKAGKLKYYGIRHEGAASFAASAYGKLTKKPAACFAIAGPGSTNMYTGMWDAKVDRAPLLALTGQVATQVVGTGNFQELDLVRAFQTVADFNHRVQKDSRHSELMSLAIKHAIINRDVSHLTFPDEVQQTPSQKEAKGPENRMPKLVIEPDAEALNISLKMIEESSRPVIIVGHGAGGHMERITRLAEKLNCPVLTTFKGKGLISDDHPLGCGVLGRSGTPIASWFMNEADLLLVIGASFSNHTGITPKKRTIQIDMDPMALAKFHQVDSCIWGEIGATVELIQKKLGKWETIDQRPEIAKRWKIWKDEKKNRLQDNRGKGISSISVFDSLTKLAPENAIMCVDVGNNAYSFGRYFESKQHTFLMSGYLGSIGFAFPASIGAWAAMGTQRPVIAVAGDGGFGQYMADFTTAVKYKMNIKVIILNNNELGKISKEQKGGDLNVFATDLVNPDFASFAKSCGAFGVKIIDNSELENGLTSLFDHSGPGLIEIRTDSLLI